MTFEWGADYLERVGGVEGGKQQNVPGAAAAGAKDLR